METAGRSGDQEQPSLRPSGDGGEGGPQRGSEGSSGAWGWGWDEGGKEVGEPDTPDDSTTKTWTETPAWQVREARSWGTKTHRAQNDEARGQEGGRESESQPCRNQPREFLILFILKTKANEDDSRERCLAGFVFLQTLWRTRLKSQIRTPPTSMSKPRRASASTAPPAPPGAAWSLCLSSWFMPFRPCRVSGLPRLRFLLLGTL